eukprot:3202445-Amphidinium_carterae.1
MLLGPLLTEARGGSGGIWKNGPDVLDSSWQRFVESDSHNLSKERLALTSQFFTPVSVRLCFQVLNFDKWNLVIVFLTWEEAALQARPSTLCEVPSASTSTPSVERLISPMTVVKCWQQRRSSAVRAYTMASGPKPTSSSTSNKG